MSVSFNPSRSSLSRIFTIGDVDLNFSELKDKLKIELDVSESLGAFKKVIHELKTRSAPTSSRNSDTTTVWKKMLRSHSGPNMFKLQTQDAEMSKIGFTKRK